MRSDLLEQLHDCVCPCELDLANSDRGASVEFTGLAFERVQSVQAEELVHQSACLGVQLLGRAIECLIEVLNHHILRVGTAETIEVYEQVVPGLLLIITVLESLESQEGASPSKGSNDVLVFAKDIKGSTNVRLGFEIVEDGSSVVGWLFALEYAAG